MKPECGVQVRVTTNARTEAISAIGARLIVWVKEPAEQNRANQRVKELIAIHFGVDNSRVHIVRGHRRPNKVVLISHSQSG